MKGIIPRAAADIFQVGKINDLYIKGCYSLLGTTSPTELISLLTKCDLVICADNFVMHAAKLVNKPAIVLWGPTNHEVYGYKEHTHFQADVEFCEYKDKCIGPHCAENYATICPLNEQHCLNKLNIDYIKIDGSFIRKLHASKFDCLFVKAIVDVAKGMEIKTIAEFVENEETILILKEYGVDYAQGYFIGKPSPDI